MDGDLQSLAVFTMQMLDELEAVVAVRFVEQVADFALTTRCFLKEAQSAWLLAQSGANLDEALGLARTANEKLPNTPSIIDTIGWVYYKKGAYASAVDSFRECVGKAPNNAACQYHLGLSYSKIGDPRSARVALEQGLKLNPAAPEATEAKTVLATLASR